MNQVSRGLSFVSEGIKANFSVQVITKHLLERKDNTCCSKVWSIANLYRFGVGFLSSF